MINPYCVDNLPCPWKKVEEKEGGEDEGWLMDFVYFPSNHSSAWIVWNARHLFHHYWHCKYFYQCYYYVCTMHYWLRPIGITELCLSFYPRPNISDRFTFHFIFAGTK